MPISAHKNFALTTLATPPSGTGGTSCVVATGTATRFPAVPFNATIWPASVQPTVSNAEIVRVTNISSDTLTITRAQEGSSARTFSANDQIAATITARTLTDVEYGAHGVVNVKDPVYGAMGDDTTDDTAAIQAAITAAGAGGCVVFPQGTYRCVGLTSSAAQQSFIGYGQVILKKNGNGVILAHSGHDAFFQNIQFRGDASSPVYTGNNLNLTGNNPTLLMCGSRYAYARAVLATGNHVQIIGTNDIYQTTDATASGYDIEIGVSGTATLYHELYGIYSSQSTGGIKLIDTGSASITGGQFGKLWIAAGTGPAGVNGGKTSGCRILGIVTVDVSTALFTANQFGASANITLGASTTGVSIDASNSIGGTVTNNGNDNNVIVKQTSAGSTIDLRFGDDVSTATMSILPTASPYFRFPAVKVTNNSGYYLRNAADDGDTGSLISTSGNNVQLISATSGASLQQFVTTGGKHQRVINSVVVEDMSASGHTLGTAAAAADTITVHKKATTGIANAVATAVATITVPNAAHSATIRFTVVGSLGAGGAIGANEASAANSYLVTIARTAGVNAVGTISAAFGAAASAVAGADTVTATLGLGAVAGAVGATNTIPVQVTISRGGGSSTNHTAQVMWEILNANATGVTVA